MMLYHQQESRAATGRLFSKMMGAIILLTTIALISFGPQSSTHEVFGGRTASSAEKSTE